jgi:beta-glucosidase
MASNHLDVHFSPLYPFGFGLSYANLQYSEVMLSSQQMSAHEPLNVSVDISNESDFDTDEIVQLYIRDLVASTTRPIKELKGFRRVHVKAKSKVNVSFEITEDLLGFYGQHNTRITEAGKFYVWIATDSASGEYKEFSLVK